MRCQEIEDLLSAYADDELAERDERLVHIHLSSCGDCSKRLTRIIALQKARAIPEGFDVSPQLAEKLDSIAGRFAKTRRKNVLQADQPGVVSQSVRRHKLTSKLKAPQWQKVALAITAVAFVSILAVKGSGSLINQSHPATAKATKKTPTTMAKQTALLKQSDLLIKGPDREVSSHDIDDTFNKILTGELDAKPEDLGYNQIVTVDNAQEARKRLGYNFPVPTSAGGFGLKAFYIEMGDVLYVKLDGGVFIIYHHLPAVSKTNPKDTANQKSSKSNYPQVTIRGHDALMASRSPDDTARIMDSLSWYEGGLNIAIYSAKDAKAEQLIKIAKSMRFTN